MTFMNRVLNRLTKDKWTLLNDRQLFIDHLWEQSPMVIEAHYRSLGVDESMRWGDKNPHYADAKTDPECLDLIDRMFPHCQFINIVRDGRAVVASLVRLGWVELPEAIDVWRRHVEHADAFMQRMPDGRAISITYEGLMSAPHETIDRVFEFLGLAASEDVRSFLDEQEVARTPFSTPTALDGDRSDFGLTSDEMKLIESEIGGTLARAGYVG